MESAEPVSDDLLQTPIERTLVNRLLVFGGPLGLFVAITASLGSSQLKVRHSVVVAVEQQWVPGRTVPIRAQLVDHDLRPLSGVTVRAALVAGDREALALGELRSTGDALPQALLTAPAVALGPATLRLDFAAEGVELTESIAIEVVHETAARPGELSISRSIRQWADDTDPQPPNLRVDLRVFGRLLAGFDNRLMLRVTRPDGSPFVGPAELALIEGEFANRVGRAEGTEPLWAGSTDAAGLAFVDGHLTSESVRVRARALGEGKTLAERNFRHVSFAGAVEAVVSPPVVRAGDDLEVVARALSTTRTVYVDAFGSDGRWVGLLDPPVLGREPPRLLSTAGFPTGLVQLQAYAFTNLPGESTAVARALLTAEAPELAASVRTLTDRHRAALSIERIERDFDVEHERAYLAYVDAHPLASVRTWLLGTLPVEIHRPPTALITRDREQAAVADRKRFWRLAVRWFLLGGGGAFLVVLTALMMRSHQRAAAAVQRELARTADGDRRESLLEHFERTRHAALTRGIGLVAIMAGALGLTTWLLENLL